MINKKVKIINWLCLVLSALALILECMPKSIEMRAKVVSGYLYSYGSYFDILADPAFWIVWVIVIFTIVTLLLNIITMFKDKVGICIASLVLQSVAAIFGVLIVATAYNVTISAICLIQIVAFNVKLKIAYQDIGKLKKSAQIFLTVVSFIVLIGSVVMLCIVSSGTSGAAAYVVAIITMIVSLAESIMRCIYLKGGSKASN